MQLLADPVRRREVAAEKQTACLAHVESLSVRQLRRLSRVGDLAPRSGPLRLALRAGRRRRQWRRRCSRCGAPWLCRAFWLGALGLVWLSLSALALFRRAQRGRRGLGCAARSGQASFEARCLFCVR